MSLRTVVQHSAFGYNQDPMFKHGLESRSVTDRDAVRVLAAGGLLFADYVSAEDYCDMEQYPNEGMVPHAPGTFNYKVVVDGFAIYVPEDTKTIHVPGHRLVSLANDAQIAQDAALGDSNDREIDLLRGVLESALDMLGIALPEPREQED